MFDLFWLTTEQIRTLTTGTHHSALDDPTIVKTEINVFSRANLIALLLKTVQESEEARSILTRFEKDSKSQFTLTPEFLSAVSELHISIPFQDIQAETSPDNIHYVLEQASGIESHGLRSKEENR